MAGEVKKNLQEIVNIIVALNGCENCYDEDTAQFKPWEVVDMLSTFADPEKVAAIRERSDLAGSLKPIWEVPGEYTIKRKWHVHTYPDNIEVETTYEQRNAFYKVQTHSVFWVNLLDSPWSDSRWVGWSYVISFPEEAGLHGKYLVRENDLFVRKDEITDPTRFD